MKKKIYLWITEKEEQKIKDLMLMDDRVNYRDVLSGCLKGWYRHQLLAGIHKRKDLTGEKKKLIEKYIKKLY